MAFSILALVGISGWITSLPTSSMEKIVDGCSVAFLCSILLALPFGGSLPGIGQIAFWFVGRPVIRAILEFFQIPDVNWGTPPLVNQFLARWHIPPVHSSLVEFLFWGILIISIEISTDRIISWFRRRAAAIPAPSSPHSEPPETLNIKEAVVKAKRYPSLRLRFIDKVLTASMGFSFLALLGISGGITRALPISSKVEAFTIGSGLAFVCFFLAFGGFLPGIGQVAFWFLGRPVVRAIFWLFQLPDVNWDTSPVVNQFLARRNIPPVHSTLVEFLFWAILIISIEISIDSIIWWFRRRAIKRYMQSQDATSLFRSLFLRT